MAHEYGHGYDLPEDYESPPDPSEEEELYGFDWGADPDDIISALMGGYYESPQGGGTIPMLQHILINEYGIGTPEWWEEVGDEYTWDDILLQFDPYDTTGEQDELREYLGQVEGAGITAGGSLWDVMNEVRNIKRSSGYARQGISGSDSAYRKTLDIYNLETSGYRGQYEHDVWDLRNTAVEDFYDTISELAGMGVPMGGGGDEPGWAEDWGGPFGSEEEYMLGYKNYAESTLPPWLYDQMLGGYNWTLGEDDPGGDEVNPYEVYDPETEATDDDYWDWMGGGDPWDLQHETYGS